jgi:hypothetical protein
VRTCVSLQAALFALLYRLCARSLPVPTLQLVRSTALIDTENNDDAWMLAAYSLCNDLSFPIRVTSLLGIMCRNKATVATDVALAFESEGLLGGRVQ